jgi:hypothetical protein
LSIFSQLISKLPVKVGEPSSIEFGPLADALRTNTTITTLKYEFGKTEEKRT